MRKISAYFIGVIPLIIILILDEVSNQTPDSRKKIKIINKKISTGQNQEQGIRNIKTRNKKTVINPAQKHTITLTRVCRSRVQHCSLEHELKKQETQNTDRH